MELECKWNLGEIHGVTTHGQPQSTDNAGLTANAVSDRVLPYSATKSGRSGGCLPGL